MGSAFVTASAASDWQRGLHQRGIDAEDFDGLFRSPILQAHNFDQQVIDLKDFVSTVEKVGDIKNASGISWSVGLAADYSKRGKAGQAIMGSKTLGTALSRLQKFYPLIQDRTNVFLDVEEAYTTLGYRILDPDIWPRTEDALYTLGLFASFIKAAAPDVWSDVEIMVETSKNVTKKELSAEVKTNVLYEADFNGIRFPTNILNAPLNFMPPVCNETIVNLTSMLSHKNRQVPVGEKTRQAIFNGLSGNHVTQDYVAKELGLSRRTLRRKLAVEGISFQSVLDECRMRAASLEFKINANQSLYQVALKLGYSEHSTFSRAFTRWAGIPPQDFRKLQ